MAFPIFRIAPENELAFKSIPRNNSLGYHIENHCDFPSRVLVVDWAGNCFVCTCEAWLPVTVGTIDDFTSLTDVWNSPTAKAIQEDINQKKFTYCAVDRCGIMHRDQRAADWAGGKDSYYISINIDESCNLFCPSCRTSKIMHTRGAEFEKKLRQVEHMVRLLENFEEPCHIIMSGNGDPLASAIMRPLIKNFKPRPNQTIRLFTNGLLLEKQLTGNTVVDNITQYFISIDAGSKDVYEKVRLGGQWEILLRNFEWLKETASTTGASVLLKFVLQKDNFNDMKNFVELCKQYNFNGVINRLEDWGTWSNFSEHDVIGNTEHELHNQAMYNLKSVYDQFSTEIQFNSSLIDAVKKYQSQS